MAGILGGGIVGNLRRRAKAATAVASGPRRRARRDGKAAGRPGFTPQSGAGIHWAPAIPVAETSLRIGCRGGGG